VRIQHNTSALLAAAALTFSLSAQSASVSAVASAELVDIATTGTATFDTSGGFFFAAGLVNDTSPFADADIYVGLTPGAASVAGSAGGSQTALASAGFPTADSEAAATSTGDALGFTLSELDFTLDGVGSVTLTFEASVAVTLADTAGIESGEAAVTVSDVFGALETVSVFGDGALGDDMLLVTTVLMLTYDVDGFTTGFLSLETATSADTGVAPIPLPAAGWLFAGGLFSLFGLRRRLA
jgi:hypothetical protein